MPNLSCSTVLPSEYLSFKDNSSSYTSSKSDHYKRIYIFPCSKGHFTNSCCIGIIVYNHLCIKFFFDNLSKIDFLPTGKIRGIFNNSFFNRYCARGSDSYTRQLIFIFMEKNIYAIFNLCNNTFRTIPRSEEHTSELQSLRHLVC